MTNNSLFLATCSKQKRRLWSDVEENEKKKPISIGLTMPNDFITSHSQQGAHLWITNRAVSYLLQVSAFCAMLVYAI
jgi:hypothetical protein